MKSVFHVPFVATLLCLASNSFASDILLSATDSGKTVDVAPGDVVKVTLESNATTGFEWVVESLPRGVKQSGKPVYSVPAQPNPGEGGTETLSLKVGRTTGGKLILAYKRGWEKGVPAAKTFEVTLRPKSPPNEVVYASQTAVSLKTGEVLVVPFQTSSGTAGVATPVAVPKFLKRIEDKVEGAEGQGMNVGGPVTIHLRFQAVRAGSGRLTLVVRAPGHPDAPLASAWVASHGGRKSSGAHLRHKRKH